MRLLVLTALTAERDAVAAGLPDPTQRRRHHHTDVLTLATPAGIIDLTAGGIGPAATASTAGWLMGAAQADGSPYSAVIVLGLAAGFPGRAVPGDIVVATTVHDADLGYDGPEGRRVPLDFGWDVEASWDLVSPPPAALASRVAKQGLPVRTGPVVTVTDLTNTPERVAELARRYDPAALATEGAGGLIATLGLPDVGFAEIRVISSTAGEPLHDGTEDPQVLDRLAATARALFGRVLPA